LNFIVTLKCGLVVTEGH